MAAHRKNYDEAVRLYESGRSVRQVADALSKSHQAMWKILDRRGVKFRPQLKFGKDNHFYRGGAVRNINFVIKTEINRGHLIVLPCEACGLVPEIIKGRQRIQAHHDDYNFPKQVRWLCKKHHHQWHQNNTPIARTKPLMPHSESASMGGKASWAKRRALNLKNLSSARAKRIVA